MSEAILSPRILTKERLTEWSSVISDASSMPDSVADALAWSPVSVPHNWDHYHGYHEVSHGNLHGTAWYRTGFEHRGEVDDERVYAYFEGVGSYATVYVNGVELGYHAGGRTTFTVDLTAALLLWSNELLVKAEHPEGIDDLPYVCGGCWGAPNTEGSQPFGIFRPVWLERTGPVRVEPFGVHVRMPELSKSSATVATSTTLQNPGLQSQQVLLRQEIRNANGQVVADGEVQVELAGQGEETLSITFPSWDEPQLWSPEQPQLHVVQTYVIVEETLSHQVDTTFGLRWLEWPEIEKPDADHNVVSADRRGSIIHNGEVARSEDNNGLTEIQSQSPQAGVCLKPMGLTVTQSAEDSGMHADLTVQLDLEARQADEQVVDVLCEIQNEGGTVFFHQHRVTLTVSAEGSTHRWAVPTIHHPHHWSPNDPYLHRVLVELRSPDGTLWERSETLFGLRPEGWAADQALNLARPQYEALPVEAAGEDLPRERRLKLNGQPLFLNGTCEYETLLGCDHAFTDEQIAADVAMMRSAGFNAFRDAHHPHNLRYYDHWDEAGIVCWTQIGSHIWFDNERFRANYKQAVREWVKERRNHPSVIIWGLQNECSMPEDFTRELRSIIRELDPTSPLWRITTTCNGGKGSDWNVPQEWSGTYGGNCHDYDLKTAQMVGEYGAWRAFGVHTEVRYSGDENDRSESWACAAMEIKLRLGEQAREEAIGHFHWVFNTFPNPGRSADNFEGPGNHQIGSVNNKGLVTTWHQPSDLYYMFRSNYVAASTDPMVYIVSHTWPDRWKLAQPRDVIVYSNCETVELFNGIDGHSYGRQENPGRGDHFVWEGILPKTNLLYAKAYCGERVVAEDVIRLDHLPEDPSLEKWVGEIAIRPVTDQALFRVNCGSLDAFVGASGQVWAGDQAWGSNRDYGWESWGGEYENISDDLASVGYSMTPVRGTDLQGLYRHYRYGREFLKYHFRTGPGRFRVRCHFAEPWFGVGSERDASAWRLFDVAINDQVVDSRLDVWQAAGGHHRALVREYEVELNSEILTLHFPVVTVNQALIWGVECSLF